MDDKELVGRTNNAVFPLCLGLLLGVVGRLAYRSEIWPVDAPVRNAYGDSQLYRRALYVERLTFNP